MLVYLIQNEFDVSDCEIVYQSTPQNVKLVHLIKVRWL